LNFHDLGGFAILYVKYNKITTFTAKIEVKMSTPYWRNDNVVIVEYITTLNIIGYEILVALSNISYNLTVPCASHSAELINNMAHI